MNDVRTIALLAVEFWKVIRVFERLSAALSDDAFARSQSQVRYASGRLEALLAEQDIKILSFDGQPYDVNLPISAINAEDYQGEENLVIEKTIEPAIIQNMVPILFGRVFVTRVI